jgi:hypothetical protein
VRSASCAIEALKLHFTCAVVRSSFIALSSAHASLRRHALNLHWPILFDACRPLGVEFFRPFYLTHVIRLASNFSAHCIIVPLGDVELPTVSAKATAASRSNMDDGRTVSPVLDWPDQPAFTFITIISIFSC